MIAHFKNPAVGAGQGRLDHRKNNFDILRFAFAFAVLLVHAYTLSGAVELAFFPLWLSSDIAVKSFFIVSGFLIFKSYEESAGIAAYFDKRLRRIYPAYVFVILSCALLGVFLSSMAWPDYFGWGVLKYVAANLLFLNFLFPNLPGLFDQNSLAAVNGALWTLKIEVTFYFSVPMVVWAMRRFGYVSVLAGLYAVSVAYFYGTAALAVRTGSDGFLELQRQLPGQLAYFVSGALTYYYLHLLRPLGWIVPVFAVAAFALRAWLPWPLVEPMALALLVTYAACLAPYLGRFARYGDFSYGIYILHFPVLQSLVSLGWFWHGAWLALGTACLLTLVLSVLLWRWVESPWLRQASHYKEVVLKPAQA